MPTETIDGAEYWRGCEKDEIRLKRCNACGGAMFYPRAWCPVCNSTDLGWFVASGNGTVYSYTVIHRAPTREWCDRVPYVLALIDLDEGPRLMSIVRGAVDSARIGTVVRVAFEDLGTGVVPVFELSDQPAAGASTSETTTPIERI